MKRRSLKSVTYTSLAAVILAACSGSSADSARTRSVSDDLGQIEVITSGTFTAALNILGPLFEQATGIEVVTSYGSSTGGGPESIPVRIDRGEIFDVLILGRASLDQLMDEGEILPASPVNLARAEVGMAVRSGEPKPDISTRESFIETLLAAESIGYSASVSGTYLSTVLFPQLGVWDEIESKTLRVVTERVGTVVARGDVEIGFQAVSEILPIEGIDLAGTLPAELQQESWFAAGIMQTAENPEEAQRLIEFLNSEAAAPIIESTGLRPNPQ